MTDIVKTLRFLVSLDQPEKGGPYGGTAAIECVRAMAEAADKIEGLRNIIDNALEVGLLISATDTHVDSATQLHARAEEISANTLMLIPKIEDVSERRGWKVSSIGFGKV